jgi:LysR family nitrogen assimilation transcriptional regulator
MELRDLRYFVHIAELGSFTRAAMALGIAQPSLTRHMQKLEEHLGVPVFTRINRGVRLTEAGQRLLDSATRILRDVDRTTHDVSATRQVPSGKVVLGMPPTLCPVLLPLLIARMRTECPAVQLEIVPGGSIVLPEWLRSGKLDLAVTADIAPSRLLIADQLVCEEMVLITPPGQRRKKGPVSAKELLSTPLVLTEAIRTMCNLLLSPHGVTLEAEMVLNSLETIRLMVQDGSCATILPYSITRRDHAMKLVDAHRLLDGSIQRQLVIAASEGRTITSATEATAAMIRSVTREIEAGNSFSLGPS